jgi:hypothetical protein
MHPHFTYLGDNATTKVLTPNIDDSQGFSLAGTSAATAPIVYVGTVGAETVDSSGNQAPVFSFYSVSEFGSAAHPLYGKMDLVPASGRVSIDHGIMLKLDSSLHCSENRYESFQ